MFFSNGRTNLTNVEQLGCVPHFSTFFSNHLYYLKGIMIELRYGFTANFVITMFIIVIKIWIMKI